jgi:hypothetical protein
MTGLEQRLGINSNIDCITNYRTLSTAKQRKTGLNCCQKSSLMVEYRLRGIERCRPLGVRSREIAKEVALERIVAVAVHHLAAKYIGIIFNICLNLFLNIAELGIKLVVLCPSCVFKIFVCHNSKILIFHSTKYNTTYYLICKSFNNPNQIAFLTFFRINPLKTTPHCKPTTPQCNLTMPRRKLAMAQCNLTTPRCKAAMPQQ